MPALGDVINAQFELIPLSPKRERGPGVRALPAQPSPRKGTGPLDLQQADGACPRSYRNGVAVGVNVGGSGMKGVAVGVGVDGAGEAAPRTARTEKKLNLFACTGATPSLKPVSNAEAGSAATVVDDQ
jgi:hypothetical protein